MAKFTTNNTDADQDNGRSKRSSSVTSTNKIKTKSKPQRSGASISDTLYFVWSCNGWTRFWFVSGILSAIGHGLVFPAMAFFFSQSFATISGTASATAEDDDPLDQIRTMSYIFMALGTYSLILACAQTFGLEVASQRAGRALQVAWARALLRQDAAYYDTIHTAGVASSVGPNVGMYQRGIGRKLGDAVQNMTTGLGGIVFSFYSSWQVALLVGALLPVASLGSWKAMQMNQQKSAFAAKCYAAAGSIAHATVSSIRTVLALNAMPDMIRQYTHATEQAFQSAVQLLIPLGFWNGAIMANFQALFGSLVLFGSFLLYKEVRVSGCDPGAGVFDSTVDGSDVLHCEYSGADVFGALMGIFFAAQGASQVGNAMDGFAEARAIAQDAWHVIRRTVGTPAQTLYHGDDDDDDAFRNSRHMTASRHSSNQRGGKSSTRTAREQQQSSTSLSLMEKGQTDRSGPSQELGSVASSDAAIRAILPPYQIDPFSDDGLKPDDVQGEIEFQHVSFSYPTRPSETILHDLSLKIPAGKTVALVGPSGGGKSTVISMLERFYDPLEGRVMVDGMDLQDMNVAHYRKFLGYVGQEPVLFSTTIAENIRCGNPEATQAQIEAAAKQANAHEFISSFPAGYDTDVGDKGSQLSGGQKQRIALARVLIGKPRILLLDEATSALDSESELVVQDALDNILAHQNKISCLIVAHRLSTIRNADIIYVIADGELVEEGSHEELMKLSGSYYRQLVEKQEGRDAREVAVLSAEQPARKSLQDAGSDDDRLSTSSELALPRPSVLELWEQEPLLEFQNVKFSYPARPGKTIFDDFNLSIYPGETVALVGPSGGGKSTVVSLIERFYDPCEGKLVYSGQDVKTLNVRMYRNEIGYVGQEPTLYADTIGNNIAYGVPDATQERIESAAKQANAHGFITAMEEGYDTQVGENIQLSGGQKQRVAIARAIVRNPSILILDEATSALDGESEEIVQAALSELMKSRSHTTIVIAHKLATIRNADRIAFIADGKVLEIGSHDSLMTTPDGNYRHLVEAQKRGSTLANLGLRKSILMKMESTSTKSKDEKLPPTLDKQVEAEEKQEFTAKRVRQLAAPDKWYIVAGSIGAFMSGASYPLMGVLFAQTIGLLYTRVMGCSGPDSPILPMLGYDTCEDYWSDKANDMQSQSFMLAIYYVLLVVDCLAGYTLLYWGFGTASERLSKRVRDGAFAALLRQEVGEYYDLRKVGTITAQLQNDAARLHAFSGGPIRQLIMAVTALLTGMIIAFSVMWPFSLMCLACVPFMAFSARMRRKKMAGTDETAHHLESNDEAAGPGGLLIETLLNIRTVSALHLEQARLEAYQTAVMQGEQGMLCESFQAGIVSGLGMFFQRFVNALLYFWGGYLLVNYPSEFEFTDFVVAQFSFLFGSFGLAAALQDLDDRREVQESAARIFSLLDRKSKIDPLSDEGIVLT